MMVADREAVLQRLRTSCLALPETDEVVSHGSPAFRVAGKMFCYFWHDHHGDGLTAACVKTSGRDEQDLLLEADPDLYSWLPYLGPSGWIGVRLASPELEWEHLEARLLTSWRLAAPKRLAAT